MSPGRAHSVCSPYKPRHEHIGKHAQVRFLMRKSLWVVCCVLLLGNLDEGSMARAKRRQICSLSNIENSPVQRPKQRQKVSQESAFQDVSQHETGRFSQVQILLSTLPLCTKPILK